MVKPTVSWDESSPAGSQSRALGDDRIREMKTQVREVIAVDHEMASSGQTATTGQHNKATLLVNADDPTEQANAGLLYTKDVSAKAELFFKDEDAHEIQITSLGALLLSGHFKIGQFTRDCTASSGDVAYTGVGFKPSLVIFFHGQSGAFGTCIGLDDATNHYILYGNPATTDKMTTGSSSSLVSEQLTASQSGYVKTMDSDGFTLTWVKFGSPTGTMYVNYLAIK